MDGSKYIKKKFVFSYMEALAKFYDFFTPTPSSLVRILSYRVVYGQRVEVGMSVIATVLVAFIRYCEYFIRDQGAHTTFPFLPPDQKRGTNFITYYRTIPSPFSLSLLKASND